MGNQNTDLYIVAAGHGSRLGGVIPKALVPIVGEPCLTTTLTRVASVFSRTFVVTNLLSRDVWSAYFAELHTLWPDLQGRVVNVPIRSGLGDGHATLQGLLSAETIPKIALAQNIVVMWGDVFLPSVELIHELLSRRSKGTGLVPAIFEGSPYVCLRVNTEMQCISADFSKYGESHPAGFHDQSIFRFDRLRLRDSLLRLHRCLWKHDRYIAVGGELSLLHTFHEMYNVGEAAYVYETKYNTRSFNTGEDVSKIRDEMRDHFGDTCPAVAQYKYKNDFPDGCSPKSALTKFTKLVNP